MKSLFALVTAGLVLMHASAFAQNKSHLGHASSFPYSGTATKVSATPGASKTAATGPVLVAIKLQDPPLVVAVGANAKQHGTSMTAAQQQAYLAELNQKQNAVMAAVHGLGGTELGRVSKGHNAVLVSIAANQVEAIHNIGGVIAVRPLANFTLSLADTLAYIGATAVQQSGFTGQGVRIAMLDTGIDYTHYNLGGSGNVADYKAAVAAAAGTPPANLFPTFKVVGGYDFVGEVWPNGPLAPDPNPIDTNGHGTLTADTAGGRSKDGKHVGTAPGSELYAVKVCSGISAACSGVAILEGIDYALDPSNTGTVNKPVDIINMSLGGSFGQREEDVSEAVTDIVNFGITTVVAAGNDGDIPYIVGHPSTAPEALAVGATTAVDATGIPLVINSPASIRGVYPNTQTLTYAPITSTVTGNVVYVGQGCPATSTTPADPYPSGNLAGKVFLIDRGVCAVSLKIDRAATAGAIAVLIGLVAPGDAIPFSNAGGTHFVPTLVITQTTSNLIKNALKMSAVNVTLSPNDAISLAGNTAAYSSRGPNYSYNMLKPDLSAPGTVTAAAVGTGNAETTESGTSFATPLTTGSAALLLSKNPLLAPLDLKALLMETTNTVIYANSATEPGVIAPLTRSGSGELRVNQAAASTTSAWDASNPLAVSLSFGTYRLNVNQTFRKKVIVHNYSSTDRTYQIANTYRAPNTTGVTVSMPSSILVPAGNSASFTFTATVNASALPVWTLDGGSNGGNGELLNTVEYGGFLDFTSGSENIHLPWYILPHKAADVQPASTTVALNGQPTVLTLTNMPAATAGLVDVFSLTGTGTQFPASVLPAPGSDYAVINLEAVGVRLICADAACDALAVQFGITTFGQRSHPDVPAEFDVDIDVNNDGFFDFDVFTEDIGLATTGTFSGQNGVFVYDFAEGTTTGPYAYSDADLDSANIILTAPLSALISPAGPQLNYNTPFTFEVLAFDNYYTGNLTDLIGPMQYELDMPKYYPDQAELIVPANGTAALTIIPNNAQYPFFTAPYNGNSPSQTGLLLLYTDAPTGQEASVITVTP